MPFEQYNELFNYISEHRNDTFKPYDEVVDAVLDLGELNEEHAEYKKISNLANQDKQTLKSITDLRKKMGKVMDAASIYLIMYKSKKKNTDGRDITQMVRELKNSLESEYTALRKRELEVSKALIELLQDERRQKQAELDRQEFAEKLKELNAERGWNSDDSFNNSNESIIVEDPKPVIEEEEEEPFYFGMPKIPEIEEMEKDSRVLRSVGDAGIKPKLSAYEPKPGLGMKLYGTLKHYLFTAFSIVTMPINGLFYGVTATYSLFKNGFRKNPNAVSSEHPYTGETKEEFMQTLTNVMDGGDNQAVLSDKRKIPLNYEYAIPEDPNQPPTFSVHVIQSHEGDPNTVDANGNTGHSYVSLKYTRINPDTGKAERYMTSFGLYMKGGLSGMAMELASVGTGLYQPAQINDERGRRSDVTAEYIINNKAVNKVILAAQQYEKGGYNTIERNCTNFAFDMGKAAGVEVEKYFHKANYTSEKVQWKLAAHPFVGFSASRLASDEMYKKTNRNDYSIQKFGEKMVDPEDIKHISSQSLNKEMYGYYPNGPAEAYRADRNIKLDSNIMKEGVSYGGSIYEVTRNAIQPFLNDIRAFGQANNVEKEDIDQAIENLEKYLVNRADMFQTVINKNGGLKTRDDYQAAAAIIKETVDDLDRIYKEDFKSHPDLNIPFHHMIGAYNTAKDRLYFDYQRIKFDVREIDQDLDASEAIRSFYGTVRFMGYDMPLTSYAAKLQASGSAENMVICCADSDDEIATSPQGRKVRAEMDRKNSRGLIDSLTVAQHSYLEKRAFNKKDYKQIFSEFPSMEEKFVYHQLSESMYVSEVYQSVALQHIFGGTKKELSLITAAQLDENPDLITQKMSEIFERKLGENAHEFTILSDGITEGLIEEYPKKDQQVENDWEYNELIAEQAFDRVMKAMKKNYAEPILENLATRYAISKGWNVNNLTGDQVQQIRKLYSSKKLSMDGLREKIGKRIQERLDIKTYIKERNGIVENRNLNDMNKAAALVTGNSEILARADAQSEPEIVKEALAGLITAELYIRSKEEPGTKGPSIKNYSKEVAKIKSKDFMNSVIKDSDVLANLKKLSSESSDVRTTAFENIVSKMQSLVNSSPQKKAAAPAVKAIVKDPNAGVIQNNP